MAPSILSSQPSQPQINPRPKPQIKPSHSIPLQSTRTLRVPQSRIKKKEKKKKRKRDRERERKIEREAEGTSTWAAPHLFQARRQAPSFALRKPSLLHRRISITTNISPRDPSRHRGLFPSPRFLLPPLVEPHPFPTKRKDRRSAETEEEGLCLFCFARAQRTTWIHEEPLFHKYEPTIRPD